MWTLVCISPEWYTKGGCRIWYRSNCIFAIIFPTEQFMIGHTEINLKCISFTLKPPLSQTQSQLSVIRYSTFLNSDSSNNYKQLHSCVCGEQLGSVSQKRPSDLAAWMTMEYHLVTINFIFVEFRTSYSINCNSFIFRTDKCKTVLYF